MRTVIYIACYGAILLALAAAQELRSMKRTMPESTEKFTEVEWAKIKQSQKPFADNPKAKPINQPTGSGKVKTGAIAGQIIGGANATLGQFPWQVALHVENAWLCGGSLILKNWVLTAAHCVGNSYEVLIGTISRSPLSDGGQIIKTDVSYAHESYNDYYLRNDIALVKLPADVTLTANVMTVALPPLSDASKTFEGTMATVSGFGLNVDNGNPSNLLKFVEIPVISNSECVDTYGPQTVTASTICTRHTTKSTCQGDSGGPLVYQDASNAWVQIGVVSFGSSQGCLKAPSGFARVTAFLGWISDVTSGNYVPATTTTKPPTTTTKKTAKTQKCSTAALDGLLSKCCGSAPNDIYKAEKLAKGEKAACKTPSAKTFNTYFLNKHQNAKKNNALVFDDATKKALGKESVFPNCYLKSKGAISNTTGVIDEDKMAAVLTKNQVNESDDFYLVLGSFYSCFNLFNGSIPDLLNIKAKIDGTATIILQCMQFTMIGVCQDRIVNTKCNKDFEAFDNCAQMDFIIPSSVIQKVKDFVAEKKALRSG